MNAIGVIDSGLVLAELTRDEFSLLQLKEHIAGWQPVNTLTENDGNPGEHRYHMKELKDSGVRVAFFWIETRQGESHE